MIKRLLLSVMVVMAACTVASAQRSNIQIGYGGYTQMDASDMHDGGAVNNAWGALTAGVNFPVVKNFSLGASYTFSSASYKHDSHANVYYHVFMVNGRYDYYRNSIVTLYGHLGLGVDVSHMAAGDWKENKAYFAVQASPLGAEVWLNRSIGLFGEVGYGAQGLLQAGIRIGI